MGVEKVVIRDGVCVIDIPEGVWDVWRVFEAQGNEQSQNGEGG